jgi:flavin-dependent amine oxidoreductase
MAAKVFKTGLLEDKRAADIGWSRVPLGRLHGERAAAALRAAGVQIRLGERVLGVVPVVPGRDPDDGGSTSAYLVAGDGWKLEADAVVVALPQDEAAKVLPRDAIANQHRLDELGFSAIVDVHLVYDRRVTGSPFMAAVNSPVQWVFDRTESSGLAPGDGGSTASGGRQYLAVSISAADALLGRRPEDLVSWITSELPRLLPSARGANVVDSLVTKERRATFAARPGSGRLRPAQASRLPGLSVAGAWTDTGWPATMEGAVRSGRAAADACLSGTLCSSLDSAMGDRSTGRPPQVASTHQEVA